MALLLNHTHSEYELTGERDEEILQSDYFPDRFTGDRTPDSSSPQPANYCWYLMGLVFRRTIV
ncbi:MAG: hypothetical protein ACRC62_21500 [Microcoleus sp.]